MSSSVQRKLTTILAADADGYSRVMEADEVGTLGALRAAGACSRGSSSVIMAASPTLPVMA